MKLTGCKPRLSGSQIDDRLDNRPTTPRQADVCMILSTRIQVPSQGELEALCRRWRIREVSLFGSVLRDDFSSTSDVDVLVSFEEDAPWSLWDLVKLRDELSTLFSRPVDLVELEGLRNPFRRQRILQTRQIIYDGGKG